MNARSLLLVALFAAVGCGHPKAPAPTQTPGLLADPTVLPFLCVTPGCDTTQPVQVDVVGSRDIAVLRVALIGPATDYTLGLPQPTPFIAKGASQFAIQVRYTPHGSPATGATQLAIDYTDASGEDSPDRIPPGRVTVSLVPRLVGEPVLAVTPQTLSFGAVDAGQPVTLSVILSNAGFGNVALQIASVDAGSPDLQIGALATSALAPDASVPLPITYAPLTPSYLRSEVVIAPTAQDVDPAVVTVEGTSLPSAQIAINPSGALTFGEVSLEDQATLSPTLVNQGGQPLHISSIQVSDPSGQISAALASGSVPGVLAPLQRMALKVSLDAKTPGPLNATMTISSDDPAQPTITVPIGGTVDQPQAQLSPTSIDFGTVPVGWVLDKPIQIQNVGFGKLTVKNIMMAGGSSTLFTLGQLPALPTPLDRNQSLTVIASFSAATAASFGGTVSVETNDPVNPFQTVAVTATGGSCQAGCPIAHGSPDCSTGTCQVGTCSAGWVDTNNNPSDGCECQDITTAGSTCEYADYVGTLKDTDNASATYVGKIPTGSDVDLVKFWAQDAFSFGDNFDVHIQLSSADPGIQMCVYRSGGGYDSTCYFTEETCPSNGYYQKSGSNFSDDSANFIVKVYRATGSTATCTPYTLYMENGD